MGALLLSWFGGRVTVFYNNGAKVTLRMSQFDFSEDSQGREITWKTPRLSFSRKPLYMNVDEIYAIWQGRH